MSLQAFDALPHLQLLREMLRQVFATPVKHAKSKPFFDHVISFHVADGRVWIRNYQARSCAPNPPAVSSSRGWEKPRQRNRMCACPALGKPCLGAEIALCRRDGCLICALGFYHGEKESRKGLFVT